jgi:hypothetical protein
METVLEDTSGVRLDEYQRHVITAVVDHGDGLTIKYGGRAFNGIMLDQLPAGVPKACALEPT